MSSVVRARRAERAWAEEKDIILSAVGSDDKSLIIDFQGWVLYEWENTRAHTHPPTRTHTKWRKWWSQTPAGSATQRQIVLQPGIWHTEVPRHSLKLGAAAYVFSWELSVRGDTQTFFSYWGVCETVTSPVVDERHCYQQVRESCACLKSALNHLIKAGREDTSQLVVCYFIVSRQAKGSYYKYIWVLSHMTTWKQWHNVRDFFSPVSAPTTQTGWHYCSRLRLLCRLAASC